MQKLKITEATIEKPEDPENMALYAYRSQTIPGLLSGLDSIRQANLFSDVCLIAQDDDTEVRLSCHRVVLAAASPVFRAIMTSVQTHDILLRRVEPFALRGLVDYLYTGTLSISAENAVALLKAGHRFGCPFIAKTAGQILSNICVYQNQDSCGVTAEQIITTANWLDVYS